MFSPDVLTVMSVMFGSVWALITSLSCAPSHSDGWMIGTGRQHSFLQVGLLEEKRANEDWGRGMDLCQQRCLFLSHRPASATRGKVTLDLIAKIIQPSVFLMGRSGIKWTCSVPGMNWFSHMLFYLNVLCLKMAMHALRARWTPSLISSSHLHCFTGYSMLESASAFSQHPLPFIERPSG